MVYKETGVGVERKQIDKQSQKMIKYSNTFAALDKSYLKQKSSRQ